MVKKFYLFLLIQFCVSPLFAQEITVSASTDTTDYMIGDHIKYILLIEMNKDVYIINPFFRDSLKNIDVISISNPIAEENETGKSVKYNCVLSRFDSAEITIPPIKIEYRTKGDSTLKFAFSNPVTFSIHRMDVSIKEEIKDIKPPIRLFNYLFIIYIAIALVILSIGYFIYRIYFKNKPQSEIKIKEEKIPFHKLTLRKLDQLEKEELWQKGFVKDYHSRITDIIREYFENQFRLPALERTTTESLKLLSKHPQGIKILDTTSQFLNNADLVKFAKYTPLEIVNQEMMTQAKDIVMKTALLEKAQQVKEEANV
ncbi:MAG: hypothetical protein Q8M94_04900 [Ignavibacteria bacterium]|nr:hypothetical protein [Ignavibacteria bacterium]